MKRFILIAALALAGCGPQSNTPSPASAVYAVKNTYEAALIVAVNYNKLPRCGAPTSPPVCSDQNAVLTIRKANVAAQTAIDAAEKTVRDPATATDTKTAAVTAATNAVDALQSILTLYTPKTGA